MAGDTSTHKGNEEADAKGENEKYNSETNQDGGVDKNVILLEAEDILERIKYQQELVDLERKVGIN